MATGGQKRTRSERVAALELPPGRWERMLDSLRRREVLMRIGLSVIAAVAICGVIRAWHPPFPYRAGAVPSREIEARTAFYASNPGATRAAREQAEREVRYVYAHDPEPLRKLRSTLRNRVQSLLSAPTFHDVNPEMRSEFVPPPDEINAPSEEQLQRRFTYLQAMLDGDENLARFEKMVAAALEPFESRGLLHELPQELNQNEILVYPADRPQQKQVTRVSDVLVGNGTAIFERLRAELGSDEVASLVFDWLRPRLPATLTLDEAATQNARQAAVDRVPEVVREYKPGQSLAKLGQPLAAEQIEVLRLEHEAFLAERSLSQKVHRAVAVAALVLGLFAVCGYYLSHRQPAVLADLRQYALVLVAALGTVVLARWAAADALRAEIVPLLLFAQVVAIVYRQEMALLLAAVLAAIIVLGLGYGLGELVILLGVSVVAIVQLAHIRNRTKLITVGIYSALAAFALTLLVAIMEGQAVGISSLKAALITTSWTLASGFLMMGLLPYIERYFGVLTDIRLLELCDVSHPLLQELVRRAPSTYNHSITVASIAEAAADAIGARGLLVRVGAYFHDIGKMLKPEYFIENQQPDVNRHDALIPAMSTLVIIAHIKDGADLARQHKLPAEVIDFIEQHHGTTLVEFFYGRASEQSREDPNGATVDESSFRYPGPRPQSKEACVLMLCDAAESACRSLVEPGPACIENLVREIVKRKLDDGQFDESNLTLRELRTIQNSITKSLIANYHGRVKYPEQKTA
jgi:putative nucleotidyltransferase with HDIG domain